MQKQLCSLWGSRFLQNVGTHSVSDLFVWNFNWTSSWRNSLTFEVSAWFCAGISFTGLRSWLAQVVCCDICEEKSIKCDHHLKIEGKRHLLSPLLVSAPSSFRSSNFCSNSNNNPLKTTISPCLYLLIFTWSFWSIFLHVLHLLSWRDIYYSLYLHDCFDENDIREAIIPSIFVKFFA